MKKISVAIALLFLLSGCFHREPQLPPPGSGGPSGPPQIGQPTSEQPR